MQIEFTINPPGAAIKGEGKRKEEEEEEKRKKP